MFSRILHLSALSCDLLDSRYQKLLKWREKNVRRGGEVVATRKKNFLKRRGWVGGGVTRIGSTVKLIVTRAFAVFVAWHTTSAVSASLCFLRYRLILKVSTSFFWSSVLTNRITYCYIFWYSSLLKKRVVPQIITFSSCCTIVCLEHSIVAKVVGNNNPYVCITGPFSYAKLKA